MTSVRSVARRPLPPAPKLAHTQADLREPAARRALAGVDVLWHLGFQLWRPGWRNALDGANRGGVDAVLAAEPRHIVFASSAAVYGAWPDNPVPMTAAHLPRPNREVPYARDKLDAERRLADAVPTAVLRISAVLGPHADPRIARSAQGYRLAVPAIRGAKQALQFLDEDDAAQALYQAGKAGAAGLFNVATADWLGEEEMVRVSGGRLVRLPRRVVLGGAEVAARVRMLPFGADRAALLNGPLALDSSAAATGIGWRPGRTSADVLGRFLCRS